MDDKSVQVINAGNEDAVRGLLLDFNCKNAQTFVFPGISRTTKQQLLDAIVHRLNGRALPSTQRACLESIRILSREKRDLDTIVSETTLATLTRHAGLATAGGGGGGGGSMILQGADDVVVEAQKCLCNIIYNSSGAQRICSSNGSIEGIVQRLKTYQDPKLLQDIKYYDMRILFLLTALCADIRPKLFHELHGFTYLIEVLDLPLRGDDAARGGGGGNDGGGARTLTDEDVDLCSEILKILFNLTESVDRNNLDEEEEAHFLRLVSVLHDLLISPVESREKRDELHSHTVNLLTNMPRLSYEELLTPLIGGSDDDSVVDDDDDDGDATDATADADGDGGCKKIEFDGKNMEAVLTLLEFLEARLKAPSESTKEALAPILHCMCEICRGNRSIRKFCRLKVLPYLAGDVKRLPEEGSTLRNKVCRLFTSPVSVVKDLSADFIFVLCKESVSRFVKYTGYGNAAGLLAQRGLMCGSDGALKTTDYSSESDDSETEEYDSLQQNVNPITGRWELPCENPMAGMSEEQKEHEAMVLVNKLDKLQRAGLIQPSRIGEDGQPHAVEHILELVADTPREEEERPGED